MFHKSAPLLSVLAFLTMVLATAPSSTNAQSPPTPCPFTVTIAGGNTIDISQQDSIRFIVACPDGSASGNMLVKFDFGDDGISIPMGQIDCIIDSSTKNTMFGCEYGPDPGTVIQDKKVYDLLFKLGPHSASFSANGVHRQVLYMVTIGTLLNGTSWKLTAGSKTATLAFDADGKATITWLPAPPDYDPVATDRVPVWHIDNSWNLFLNEDCRPSSGRKYCSQIWIGTSDNISALQGTMSGTLGSGSWTAKNNIQLK